MWHITHVATFWILGISISLAEDCAKNRKQRFSPAEGMMSLYFTTFRFSIISQTMMIGPLCTERQFLMLDSKIQTSQSKISYQPRSSGRIVISTVSRFAVQFIMPLFNSLSTLEFMAHKKWTWSVRDMFWVNNPLNWENVPLRSQKSELDKSVVMAQSQMSLFLEYPFLRKSIVTSLKKHDRSSHARHGFFWLVKIGGPLFIVVPRAAALAKRIAALGTRMPSVCFQCKVYLKINPFVTVLGQGRKVIDEQSYLIHSCFHTTCTRPGYITKPLIVINKYEIIAK